MAYTVQNQVVLLKALSDLDHNSDPYVELIGRHGFAATILPVMTFESINEEDLCSALENVSHFDGLIFTSQRAVVAVHCAMKNIQNADSVLKKWQKLKVFAVGDATTTAAKHLLELIADGRDCGSSEKLSVHIVESCKDKNMKFLFPCSSLRRETMIQILKSNGIQIYDLPAYKPVENKDLGMLWENLISNIEGIPEVLVFYSPSGVKIIDSLFKCSNYPLVSFKIIALGPSTKEELCKIGVEPLAVCEKPNPASLVKVLKSVL